MSRAGLYKHATNSFSSRRVVVESVTGNAIERIRHSAWRVAAQEIGSDDIRSVRGRECDSTGLYYSNARYYDPTTARFLTEDLSRQGVNWYAYCGDNPVNRMDPTGMREIVDDGANGPVYASRPSRPERSESTQPQPSELSNVPTPSRRPYADELGIPYPKREQVLDPGNVMPTQSNWITSEYGTRHPLGIDIGAVTQGVAGDPVVASLGGTVTFVGVPDWSKSQSPYVVTRGVGGREYRYAHLDTMTVKIGQNVVTGQQIGQMGDVGAPGQVHLHSEVREGGRPIDLFSLIHTRAGSAH